MKKQLIVLFSLFSLTLSVSAQKEFKLAKSSGKLNLNINGAIVEGYSGNEIIFSNSRNEVEAVDERAIGLRSISGSGFADNTGLGIDVSVKGEDINVNMVSKNLKGLITIKVPQNVKVSFNNSNVIGSDEVFFKNLKNEIEISVSYNKVKLENNSGPMNVKALHGSVDAVFAGEIKGPVSIVSVYGHVDVSLPANVKANVELATNYGNIYAAEGFKIVYEKKAVDKDAATAKTSAFSSVTGTALNTIYLSNTSRNGENIKGTINGGGVDLILKSNFKNVYLRDK